eukprot:scaffold86758_cov64-Attheya_sp.AAC.2
MGLPIGSSTVNLLSLSVTQQNPPTSHFLTPDADEFAPEDFGDKLYAVSRVILKCHEVEKKQKYLSHCEHQHKHFTPLVFLVDRMMGVWNVMHSQKEADTMPINQMEADI